MNAARRIAVMMALPIILARAAAAQPSTHVVRDDPFADSAWMLSLSAGALTEAWNYNDNHEEIYAIESGLQYAVRDGLALGVTSLVAYVSQRGVDAYMVGWLGGVRWAAYRRGRGAVSLNLDVGMVRGELAVPPRGTRFNYLFRPSISASWPVSGSVHALVSAGWLHLSNNSLNGRHHNPDIQAVGITAGALIPF